MRYMSCFKVMMGGLWVVLISHITIDLFLIFLVSLLSNLRYHSVCVCVWLE